MPITLQRRRSSSDSNLKPWEKRTRSRSSGSLARGDNTSASKYSNLLPPNTPTTTATKSHPITPPNRRPSAFHDNRIAIQSTKARVKNNNMGGDRSTAYGEVTEILMGGLPSASDHHADPARHDSSTARRRSRSLSSSRHLDYQNPDNHSFYVGQSMPFPRDEGIEAILPSSVRKTTQVPALPFPTDDTDDSHRRYRWTCFSPKLFDRPIPPVLTAASSSEESGQERQRASILAREDEHHQWDYAFDADVWKASPPRGEHVNKNEVSLVDTTFISNSSASASITSSPHNDRLVTLDMTAATAGATSPEELKTKKKPSLYWKKRLKFWKSRPKEKRSSSLEPIDTFTKRGGGSPYRKDFISARAMENEKNVSDDIEGGDELRNIEWEAHVIEGDQVECEYRGNVGLRDWFMGQEVRSDEKPILRTPSFLLTELSPAEGEHSGNENPAGEGQHSGNENPALSVGEDEQTRVDTKEVPKDDTSNVVMELGHYARTMQPKQSVTTSLKEESKMSSSSLLCALPGLLGKKRSKEGRDSELENLRDPEEEVLDYESDNNSYLAVSYTEECAQLVMQQSEEVQDAPTDLGPQPAKDPIPGVHPQSSPLADAQSQQDIFPGNHPLAAPADHEQPQPARVNDERDMSSIKSSPPSRIGFEHTGLTGEKSDIFRADTDLMSDDLLFLAEHSIRSQSIKTVSSSTLGASFGHPAAKLRDDLFTQQRLRHPPPITGKESDDDPSEKLFKAITQGLNTSDVPLPNKTIPKIKGSPSDTRPRTRHSLDKTDSRPFEREVVGGITYHHYKAMAPPPPPPPPPLPANKGASAKIATRPDDVSIHTPPPIKIMRDNLFKSQMTKNQGEPVVNSHEEGTKKDDDGILRDLPDQIPDDEAQAQVQAAQMYRYYCPAGTSYRASLAESTAKYRSAVAGTASKYRGACTPTKMPTFELSQPTELSWDNSTAPTLGSRSMSTLSYFDTRYSQGRRSTSLAPTAADIWDVYGPVKQMAKEVGESLCENVYPRRRGQPPTVPFSEMSEHGKHRRPYAKERKSGKVNHFDRGYHPSDRENDDHPWRDKQLDRPLSQDEASITSDDGSKPDPPSVLSDQVDTRRQLL